MTKNTVRKTTGLHEKTVQSAGTLAGAHAPKKRGRGKSNGRNSRVTVVKVNPLAWKAALDLAQGDKSRLRINSVNSITVVNPKVKENA